MADAAWPTAAPGTIGIERGSDARSSLSFSFLVAAETTRHPLFFCDVSQSIWSHILGSNVVTRNDESSFEWLHAARNEVIQGNVNHPDLSILMETIEVSFNQMKSVYSDARSQSRKFSSGERISIYFDVVVKGSYSVAAVVATHHNHSLIHLEAMRIDSTDVDVAQANAAWMAATITLRWLDNACEIGGNSMDIINAIIRSGAPCQSISKIISYIHEFYDRPTTTW
ncbi:hypothetical protein Ancab_019547, partial [Ancistrocladus abbreviatus]